MDSTSTQQKEDRTEQLRKIRDEVVYLKTSPLYEYRIKNKYYPVIGEGSHYADIMFIGEAPGRNEAETAHPFCGAAGKILDELLESIGLHREEVYITNVVKDRPPANRDPLPEEIEIYGPFLDRQIDIIKPKIIATLGRFSMRYIMKKFGIEDKLQPISKIHGQVFKTEASYGKITIIPLYHPAVVIYNPKSKIDLQKNFEKLNVLLKK